MVLGYLFLGTQAPGCLDSADTGDSGTLENADAVAILEFLFSGSAVPPPPGPLECGSDPSPNDLSCSRFPGC